MGSKSSPPPAPDYKGAAEQTAASQRVNQVTPYGSLTYSAPSSGNSADPWTQTISLSPEQQQLLSQQNQLSLGLGALGQQGLGYVQDTMNNLPNASDLPAQQINAGQTAQDAIMARLEPSFQRQEQQLQTRLANQGIAQGSEAYKNATSDFGQQRNDAMLQAALRGIDVGQQARQQALQEQNYYTTQPINLLNAVRSGSQVSNPTFGQTGPGANYAGAAAQQGQYDMNAYNQRVGQQNSMMGGLFGLGTAGAMFLSDRRLKSNIVRVGDHPLGIGIYEYEIFGQRQRGVMADEV